MQTIVATKTTTNQQNTIERLNSTFTATSNTNPLPKPQPTRRSGRKSSTTSRSKNTGDILRRSPPPKKSKTEDCHLSELESAEAPQNSVKETIESNKNVIIGDGGESPSSSKENFAKSPVELAISSSEEEGDTQNRNKTEKTPFGQQRSLAITTSLRKRSSQVSVVIDRHESSISTRNATKKDALNSMIVTRKRLFNIRKNIIPTIAASTSTSTPRTKSATPSIKPVSKIPVLQKNLMKDNIGSSGSLSSSDSSSNHSVPKKKLAISESVSKLPKPIALHAKRQSRGGNSSPIPDKQKKNPKLIPIKPASTMIQRTRILMQRRKSIAERKRLLRKKNI